MKRKNIGQLELKKEAESQRYCNRIETKILVKFQGNEARKRMPGPVNPGFRHHADGREHAGHAVYATKNHPVTGKLNASNRPKR
ncbi:MAG: hypothetical protein IKH57_26185 [Clostridia bacterium]|nr:hypothetical protein [Clostridia bacterium]